MNALLPLLIPLVVGASAAELPPVSDAPASPHDQKADLVEVHLGANTPGVRLVVKPPAHAGPDAEPWVVELRVPPWPEARLPQAAPTAPAPPALTEEPIAEEPALLAGPDALADAVATASYATQAIEPDRIAPEPETAFLRHAEPVELEPPVEPEEPAKEAEPPPEWVAAAENFEKACVGGYAQACTALAEMTAEGRAGDPDLERARTWYERGCDGGDRAACDALAPASPSPAAPSASAPTTGAATAAAGATPAFALERQLFDACQQGDNGSCNELGERHTHGDGVSQDYQRAAKLFQRACAGGEMAACTNLGILYQVGEGVSQDESRAERLFQLACNGGAGDQRACGLTD